MPPPIDPRDTSAIAADLERIANSLKKSKDIFESLNENIDLAKELTADLKNELNRSVPPAVIFVNLAEDMNRRLNQAKTSYEKMNALIRTESDLTWMLSGAIEAQTGERVKITDTLKKISKMKTDIGKATLADVFGMRKLYELSNRYSGNISKSAEKLKVGGTFLTSMAPKFGGLARVAGGVLTGIGTKLAGLSVPVVGWILTATMLLVDLGKAIFNVFKEADTAAEKFRMTLGVTRTYTGQIDRDARAIAISFAHVGVKFETAYASVVAIAHSMGSLTGYSASIVQSVSLFTAQLGVAAEKSMDTFRAFAMVARKTMASQKDMIHFVASLSEAAGTNLGEVMGDIAEFSQNSYQFMRRSALELARSAVEAKRMGTNLASAGKSADSLIQFTQSVNAEMEASVLLGRSIDLQRARELSYVGDIAGLNQEILRLTKEFQFERLDPFQMKAFAAALGKTEAELGKIVQADRELQKMRQLAQSDIALRRQLDIYNQMKNSSRETAQQTARRYEMELRIQANQARLTALQNTWNQLIQKLAEYWLPIIDEALKALMPMILEISKAISYIFPSIEESNRIKQIGENLENILNSEAIKPKAVTPITGAVAAATEVIPIANVTPTGVMPMVGVAARGITDINSILANATDAINNANRTFADIQRNGLKVNATAYVDPDGWRGISNRRGVLTGGNGTTQSYPTA